MGREAGGRSSVGQEVLTLLERYLPGLLDYRGIGKARYLEYIITNEGKSMLMQSIEKIKKKSLKQGIEQGIEQGSHDTQVETVKKMLKKAYPLEEIVELTGLSVEEIISIAANDE
jgi:predicted transposase/invertase (TIGR01784 family)